MSHMFELIFMDASNKEVLDPNPISVMRNPSFSFMNKSMEIYSTPTNSKTH